MIGIMKANIHNFLNYLGGRVGPGEADVMEFVAGGNIEFVAGGEILFVA